MKTFSQLYESMSEEQFEKYFPSNFDPTERDSYKVALNIDDYDSALYDYIKHHWCPHQAFDELNNGNEKIAKAVCAALWSGYEAGLHRGREENNHED